MKNLELGKFLTGREESKREKKGRLSLKEKLAYGAGDLR